MGTTSTETQRRKTKWKKGVRRGEIHGRKKLEERKMGMEERSEVRREGEIHGRGHNKKIGRSQKVFPVRSFTTQTVRNSNFEEKDHFRNIIFMTCFQSHSMYKMYLVL